MKAKNILFRLKIKGNGIVNYDSSDQKWVYNGSDLHSMKTMYDNTSYAKKHFYKKDEKLNYKISISSDCLRHEIFGNDVPTQSPNVINNEHVLYSFIASPTSLIRGYLFASDKETLKRKGALTITDAEQTCGAVSTIETFSRSGLKNQDSEKVDSSFYKKETVGNIEYSAIGNIDLMQMQFVSCDQVFDRYAFNPDLFNIYSLFFKSKLKSFDSKLGYYQIKNSMVEIPEYGVLITNDNIVTMIRSLFTRLKGMKINRKSAYAATDVLEYKIVYDVLEDTFNNEDGWLTINTQEDIDSISFDTEIFYIEEDKEAAKLKRKAIEDDYELRKKESADIKAERKRQNDEKKAMKKSEANNK